MSLRGLGVLEGGFSAGVHGLGGEGGGKALWRKVLTENRGVFNLHGSPTSGMYGVRVNRKDHLPVR